MSATATPTRDSFAETVEHWDDVPVCAKGDAPATVQIFHPCCGRNSVLFCDNHLRQHREWVQKALNSGYTVECRLCGTSFALPQRPEDVTTAVPV